MLDGLYMTSAADRQLPLAGGVPQSSPKGGIVLFESGFRPFFLAAGVYAIVPIVLWLASFGGWISGFTVYWHGHEMVYGFATAAISGFLLTAVPNWTKSERFHGAPLVLCVVAWFAGRLAMLAPGSLLAPQTAAAIDLLHLPVLAALITPRLMASRNARNAIFPLLLLTLFGVNVLFHFGAVAGLAIFTLAPRAAIYLVVVMVLIVASRVVPAFTRGALERQGHDLPEGRFGGGWMLTLTIPAGAAVLLADLSAVQPLVVGALSLVVSLLLFAHLSRWGGPRTLGEPIVWVLHAGYALLALGFGLLGASHLEWGVPATSALHAFSAGAIGTMAMAIMTRAALGHSGRPLQTPKPIVVAYLFVIIGALLRIVAPLASYTLVLPLLLGAGFLWAAGYLLFLIVYTPIFLRPRADGRPG